MPAAAEFVKDKESLPAHEPDYCAGLISRILPIAATVAR